MIMLAALKRNEKGLTLIELLAVLVIIGIIAAIAIPAIGGTIKNAETKSDAATDEMIKEAAMRYAVDKAYTSDTTNININTSGGTPATGLVAEGYLQKAPTWKRSDNRYTHFDVDVAENGSYSITLKVVTTP